MSANRKKLKTLNCLESPVRDSLWSPLHETLSQPEVMEIPKIKKSKTLPCSFDESPSTRSDDLTLTALKRKYFGESSSAAHFSNSSSLNPLTTPKRMLPSVSYNNMQADPVLIEDDEEEEYTEKEIDTETEDFQIDEDKPIQASKMNDDQSKTNCKLMKSLSLPLKPKFKELKLSKNVREKLAEDQRRNASIKPLLIGEYEIYLVADSREKRYDEESTAFVEELRLRGIKTLRRSLSVGDFLWIARKSRGKNFLDSENEAEEFCEAYSEELVLDCVVERKTVADLHHSIRDMRFDEQRHRLSTCGCSSIIYLIEGKLSSSLFGASSNKCCSNPSSALSSASSETHPLQQLKTSFPFASRYRNAPCMSAQSLKTAVCNLQTENGFTVHNSLHLDDSISFLVSVSRLLTDSNASRVNEDSLSCRQTVDGSPLLTFSDFQERNLKNKHCTVGAVWKRQLCHLRGVSSFKSEMVSNKLVTPFKVFDLIQQELITGERSRCSSSRLSLIESLNKKKETGKEKKREKAKKVDKSVGSDVAETIKAFFKRDDNCCKEM
ncbi:Crossover junction endonuclease MUS81 [Monocercomonoides exilis]|uniref:Crossover junction endonuclease MUS81 n=1 Tax=Monocercomonoides exilis TaxID=2049356 RepID=UPI00355A914E|nr:Crossover junction endonuclease MUS81 [Monocercomonoides exilis]|eukprot:MONOS_6006.1-p1 / transcript=MONOS_6006.1 / gene=MONOS_6006 / organism=Monocercomonoides_exilis_PA203 / gene_product=Crossover junction endonuclease MUS81 / transcript_product=Crossover junction endonuclease MUS81 / location=Mono_scaffold00183:18416-20165(-) / protein_length=551 / sequence_SO=supercontig / SO=protein_coding / is_pseudo=false